MDTGNYDALRGTHEPNSAQPKLFSLTQSMHQLENLNAPQKYSRRPVGYSDNFSPFRPNGKRGELQSKRPPIFPALQRFQKPQHQNEAQHHQTPQKPPARPPFFSLLKPPTAAPTQDPPRHFYQGQSQAVESAELRMKLEQFSDKALSPSPPPHSSSTDAHIATHNDQPRPHQMLPPPPPPTGPISRPGSPTRPRSRSRSRSSTSYRPDERPIDVDVSFDNSPIASSVSQSTDLPDIAIRALREVQSVNAELTEERRRTKTVLSQLNALATAHEALKLQQSSVQQDLLSIQRQAQENAQESASAKKDLSATIQALASAKLELSSATAERDALRVKLTTEQEQAKTRFGKIKGSMLELGESYQTLRASFGELKKAYEASQSLVADLRETRAWAADGLRTIEPLLNDEGQYTRAASVKVLVGELQDEIADGRRVIDLLRDKLHHLSSQLAEAQGRLRELEAEERALLLESLKRMTADDASFALAGNGGLAEKMETLVRQLVVWERQTIGALAEAAGPGVEARLGIAHAQIEAMEAELKMLRECKDAKGILEVRVDELMQKTRGLEESLATAAVELATARTECTALKTENAGLGARFAEMQSAMEETKRSAKKEVETGEEARREVEVRMAVLQERFDAQAITLRLTKDQCVDLQERLLASEAALKGKSEEVEVLRGEGLKRMEELREVEVRSATLQEQFKAQAACLVQATRLSEDLKERLRASEAAFKARSEEVETLGEDGLKRMDESRRLEGRLTKLQEQLDAQATSLKHGEQQHKDLQKRLQVSEAALERKTEEAKALSVEGLKTIDDLRCAEVLLAKLQERFDAQAAVLEQKAQRCNDLQEPHSNFEAELTAARATLEVARQDLLTERAAPVAASLDFALKLTTLEEAKRLLQEEVMEGVTRRVSRLEDQQARETEREGVEEERRRVQEFEKEVAALRENWALVKKVEETGRLRARYEAGTLVDEEKDFVQWLINLSSELHEQEDVVKDNELRRRENMNIKMQGKIRELESALARMLKEKQKDAGVPSKSMIDLNAWMTSSPRDPDPEPPAPAVAAGPPDVVMASVSAAAPALTEVKSASPTASVLSSAAAPVPETKSARVYSTKAEPQRPASTFQALNSFSSLEGWDFEDDIPLSEMSATMHTSAAASASVLGKRERAVSPTKIVAKMKPKRMGNANTNGRRLRGARSAVELKLQEQVPVVGPKKAVDTNAKAKKKTK